MTHQELTNLFKKSGVTQKEFVQWANALGMKTRPGDVSNHKRGDVKHRIGKKYAQLYRDFFAEKADGNFREALAIATKNVFASGGDRVILDVPPEAAELLNDVVTVFGNPDFDPDQVIEVLAVAADERKAEGKPFGSLWAVANAIGGIAEKAKKLY